MAEIELKFLVDETVAKALWARARKAKLATGKPRTRMLRSIYLDTPEHALRQAGIALRLRRDGRRWVQTVKAGRRLHGPLSQAEELECAAPGGRIDLTAIPDQSMREAIAGHVVGSPLKPVCETLIRRTSGEVALEDGTRAELAVDIGEIRAEGRSAPLVEAEIELVEGSPAKLFEIARLLFPEGGLRFSRLSKSARGYLLAEKGIVEPPLVPRNAAAVTLEPGETAEAAARDVLRECVDQVAANMAVVAVFDDPEGPHQLRVGLRRLRSGFSLFGPVLDCPELTRLGEEARWLGQEVGRLRDLDVVAGEIALGEATAHPDEPGLAALAQELAARATEQRASVRALLRGARAQALILDLVRFVETRGWLAPQDIGQTSRLAMPVAELAEAALAKRWKTVRKRARHLDALDVAGRHELRKQLKKLRYACEFLAPLYQARRVGKFGKRLKALQTVFGELNDAATVKAILDGEDAPLAGEPGGRRAIGWLLGAAQARAGHGWAGAKSLWKELEATKPFWK